MRNAIFALLTLLTLPACEHSSLNAEGSDNQALVDAGHRVAQMKCATCHAIEPSGESANSNAPPFRDVARSANIMATEATLTEGIRIGHMDMPVVHLSRPEIDRLSAYLRSLQSGEPRQ
jgi:mono/diheme cytochrome c family protein